MAQVHASMSQDDYPLRSRSPSPDHQPSAALSPYPPELDRSFSTASSWSISSSAASDGQPRKRGYVRPQATVFSDSARNRDSVMSLGSIAHLQYYFARTGLLDGKGAQLAKEEQLKKAREHRRAYLQNGREDALSALEGTHPGYEAQAPDLEHENRENIPPERSESKQTMYLDDPFSTVETDTVFRPQSYPQTRLSSESRTLSTMPSFDAPPSPTNGSPRLLHVDPSLELPPEALYLPPTVSTYKQKSTYVPPPPDMSVLRRELREALDDANKLLRDLEADARERPPVEDSPVRGPNREVPAPEQWQEIQGLQVLDLITLAIRAAKNYYTSHEVPPRLYAIRSERRIRSDLYTCLEVLKKLASRNFAGGVRKSERDAVQSWVSGIEDLVNRDEQSENDEHRKRQSWHWIDGDWSQREREREFLFLRSFDEHPESLPAWSQPSDNMQADEATPFLKSMQDGLRLCQIHNSLLKSSRRQFELIKTHHMDTNLPYRCSENLKFWVKAAELRWDVLLDVDVAGVVHSDSRAAWIQFDQAILKWCTTVREELTREWKEQHEALQMERPKMRFQVEDSEMRAW